MKKTICLMLTLVSILSCNRQIPTKFSEAALNDSFVTLDGDTIVLAEILKKHQGKQIVVDVWANWCKDCIVGMPKLRELQRQYPDAVYLFLSMDRSDLSWKQGIEKYKVIGDHYLMTSGWKGPFGRFVDLDWVPRYMVIDEDGTIKMFKAVKADDKKITQALEPKVVSN